MRNKSKLKCQAKGCTKDKVGLKYCKECGVLAEKAHKKKSHAKCMTKKKKTAEAEAKRLERAKPKTKPCSRCKKVEIPVGKRLYCVTCQSITLKENKARYVQKVLGREREQKQAVFKNLGDEAPKEKGKNYWSAFSGTNTPEDLKVLARVREELDVEIEHSRRCGYGNGTTKVFSPTEIAAYQQQLQGAA